MRKTILLLMALAASAGCDGFDVVLGDAGPPPAPQLVHAKCIGLTADAGTALALALDEDVAQGDLLVVAAAFRTRGVIDPGSAVAPVTDSLGNTFAPALAAQRTTDGADGWCEQVFYAVSTSAGPDTLTAGWSRAATSAELFVHHYAGTSRGDVLDTAVGNIDAGFTPSGGPVLTSTRGDLLFAHATANSFVGSPDGGFTAQAACIGDLTADALAGPPGTYAASFSDPNPGPWITAVAAFRPAAADATSDRYALGCSATGGLPAAALLLLLAAVKPRRAPRSPTLRLRRA